MGTANKNVDNWYPNFKRHSSLVVSPHVDRDGNNLSKTRKWKPGSKFTGQELLDTLRYLRFVHSWSSLFLVPEKNEVMKCNEWCSLPSCCMVCQTAADIVIELLRLEPVTEVLLWIFDAPKRYSAVCRYHFIIHYIHDMKWYQTC